MKLKDFDFRIWNNNSKTYEAGSIIESLGFITSVFNQLTYEKPTIDYEIELWTGYFDKNGNKIYEGDILYYFKDCSEGEVFKYQVLFKEGAFYLFESYDGFVDDEDLIAEFDLKELQVMGNIHENKELLNVRL
ncbi:YopX family protein [Campylobacter coli]|uniref:YopX family protein n=1 Tax=Campylobacter coli TaxID=195 RepID=UPI002E33D1E0|nr:YopX family protein [Campylobacter coli]MED7838278.1 YopX family protein [Campylobacter coli]MED7865223.1 YopX family protein [Campylobacter coli]MED7890548.1 YopX family protein [Campylobacter coli]MED7890975.1 YopX family protein [Campylobacter coli]MED7900906.1 YopX family protein [Campylobacter coli]